MKIAIVLTTHILMKDILSAYPYFSLFAIMISYFSLHHPKISDKFDDSTPVSYRLWDKISPNYLDFVFSARKHQFLLLFHLSRYIFKRHHISV